MSNEFDLRRMLSVNSSAIFSNYLLESRQSPWLNFLSVLTILSALIYIVFVPGGYAGILLVFICFLLALPLTKNLLTLAVYFLLQGVKTFGMVTLAFGYPGIGGKIALALGFLLLLFRTEIKSILYSQRNTLAYLLWIAIVLYFFYLIGPKTEYSTYKIVNSVINGCVCVVVFDLLLNNRTVSWDIIGKLGVISVLVCLASAFFISPIIKPSWIFDVGAMRLATLFKVNIFEIRNLSGYLALISFAFLYSSNPDNRITWFNSVQFYCFSIFAIIILAWGGSRLPFISLIFIVSSIFLFKPLSINRYKIISFMTACCFFAVVVYGVYADIPFVTSVLDQSKTFGSQFNRDTNWDNAFWRISERPFLGHGLGGYYVEMYSWPGSGTYAHNILLELLSETGIIGTLCVFGPLVWKFANISFLTFFKLRAANGGALFPIILIFFLQSMISFDLSTNISFLILLFILLNRCTAKKF